MQLCVNGSGSFVDCHWPLCSSAGRDLHLSISPLCCVSHIWISLLPHSEDCGRRAKMNWSMCNVSQGAEMLVPKLGCFSLASLVCGTHRGNSSYDATVRCICICGCVGALLNKGFQIVAMLCKCSFHALHGEPLAVVPEELGAVCIP